MGRWKSVCAAAIVAGFAATGAVAQDVDLLQ